MKLADHYRNKFPGVKNREIAQLLIIWEEGLRKNEEVYHYIHEMQER